MKEENNPKFAILPIWEDCFKIIFPVNLKIGDIFAREVKEGHVDNGSPYCQLLRKVTKIELLKEHPNHLVISSVLVGATISQIICEKIKVYFWGKKESENGKRKRFVVNYYDEEHVRDPDGYLEKYYKTEEITEVFFIATNEKPTYYIVDISKLGGAKVPINEGSIDLISFI